MESPGQPQSPSSGTPPPLGLNPRCVGRLTLLIVKMTTMSAPPELKETRAILERPYTVQSPGEADLWWRLLGTLTGGGLARQSCPRRAISSYALSGLRPAARSPGPGRRPSVCCGDSRAVPSRTERPLAIRDNALPVLRRVGFFGGSAWPWSSAPIPVSRARKGPTRSPSWAGCRNRLSWLTVYRVRRPVRARVRYPAASRSATMTCTLRSVSPTMGLMSRIRASGWRAISTSTCPCPVRRVQLPPPWSGLLTGADCISRTV